MRKRRKKIGTVLERNISARVATETFDALRTEAGTKGKTMSTLVREIAENHVSSPKKYVEVPEE